MDLKIFLKNLPAFEDFSADQLARFAEHLTIGEYEDGHVFIRQGEQGDALYLLMQGAARIVSAADAAAGEDPRELNDGEMFGMLSLVENMPALATCSAKGRVKAALLTHEAFQQLFASVTPIANHLHYMIAVQMARDLQEQNRRFRTALAQD